jgi:hypothetical protein
MAMKLILAILMALPFSLLSAEPESPNNSSGFVLEKQVTKQQLSMFFDFSLEEMRNSNFGLSRDMFELIGERAPSDFPMCFYHLAQLYRQIPTLENAGKEKANLEKFVALYNKKTKVDKTFFEESYSRLIALENDPIKLAKYAKTILKISKSSSQGKHIAVSAYTKIFSITNDAEYASKIEKMSMSAVPKRSMLPVIDRPSTGASTIDASFSISR